MAVRDFAKRQARRVPGLVEAVRFVRREMRNRVTSAEAAFTHIHDAGAWEGSDSVSGRGSGLDGSERVRAALPPLLRELGARSILDAPCGDFRWMREVDLGDVEYIGADVVKALVDANQRAYGSAKRRFHTVDLIREVPPRADLVLCRDCFIHLPFRAIQSAVKNIRASGATWLLTTTFPRIDRQGDDIAIGQFHPVRLDLAPLSFPPPQRTIEEGSFRDVPSVMSGALGLWRLADLPL